MIKADNKTLDFVFRDEPNSPDMIFVEVENENRESVGDHPAKESFRRDDGYWVIRVKTGVDDLAVMKRMNEMCIESLPPALAEQWDKVRVALMDTRKSVLMSVLLANQEHAIAVLEQTISKTDKLIDDFHGALLAAVTGKPTEVGMSVLTFATRVDEYQKHRCMADKVTNEARKVANEAWLLLEAQSSPDQLIKELQEEYDIAREKNIVLHAELEKDLTYLPQEEIKRRSEVANEAWGVANEALNWLKTAENGALLARVEASGLMCYYRRHGSTQCPCESCNKVRLREWNTP